MPKIALPWFNDGKETEVSVTVEDYEAAEAASRNPDATEGQVLRAYASFLEKALSNGAKEPVKVTVPAHVVVESYVKVRQAAWRPDAPLGQATY